LKKRTLLIIISFLFSIFYLVYLYPVLVGIFVNAAYGNLLEQFYAPFQDGFTTTMIVAVLFSLGHTFLIILGIFFHFLGVLFRGKGLLITSILLYIIAGLQFPLSYFGLVPLIILTAIPTYIPTKKETLNKTRSAASKDW
jgi:hypothetical protein